MNEDSMYDSMDEHSHSLTMSVLDEFLSTNIGIVPITDETYSSQATRPLVTAASYLDGDNTSASFVAVPEVINNTKVQTNEAGPSKITPIEDNFCFAAEPVSTWFNTFDYSTANDCQHSTAILPPAEVSQLPPMINYCSPSLPVMDHTKESTTSYQNMNSISSQFQFGQQMQQGHASIMQPDTNNRTTLPQNWPSEPPYMSNANLMTMLSGSSSAIQTNSTGTTTSNDHQSQNTANSYKLVSGTSLVIGDQVNSIQTINSLGQQNTSLIEEKLIKYDATEVNRTFQQKHNIPDTVEKPFECNICHKKCRRKGDLKTHYHTHTSEQPFECSICHKKFKWKSSFNQHYLTHTSEQPFECTICHKKFKRKSSFNQHYIVHIDEKQFECNVCHRKFKWKSSLVLHHITHNDEQSFECNICHCKFKGRQTFNMHYRATHPSEELPTSI